MKKKNAPLFLEHGHDLIRTSCSSWVQVGIDLLGSNWSRWECSC